MSAVKAQEKSVPTQVADQNVEETEESKGQRGRKPINVPTIMSELYSRPAEVTAEQVAKAAWLADTFSPVETGKVMGDQTRKVYLEGIRVGMIVNTRAPLIQSWWNVSEAGKTFTAEKSAKVREALVSQKLKENSGLAAIWETLDDKARDAIVASWV